MFRQHFRSKKIKLAACFALAFGSYWLAIYLQKKYLINRNSNANAGISIPSINEQSSKTPLPPTQPEWKSPLIMNCPKANPDLRSRLLSMDLKLSEIKAHPSNYGERVKIDSFGQKLNPNPAVIVLHETVFDVNSAINTLLTPHPSDEDQVSYHTLVARSGEIIQLVPPSFRAYGAGHSAFKGRWIFYNKNLSGSVNNFALHVSLETPEDGFNDDLNHSGYSSAQYDALSRVLADWMIRYQIAAEAITTHRHVDLAGARADPRSFNWQQLQKRLTALQLVCKNHNN